MGQKGEADVERSRSVSTGTTGATGVLAASTRPKKEVERPRLRSSSNLTAENDLRAASKQA